MIPNDNDDLQLPEFWMEPCSLEREAERLVSLARQYRHRILDAEREAEALRHAFRALEDGRLVRKGDGWAWAHSDDASLVVSPDMRKGVPVPPSEYDWQRLRLERA